MLFYTGVVPVLSLELHETIHLLDSLYQKRFYYLTGSIHIRVTDLSDLQDVDSSLFSHPYQK